MTSPRTHYVATNDGVAIGATVHGQGPPLVFLHGAIGDGDIDWQWLLPHLTDQFTCHLPSIRGRGLSGDHPDLRLRRVIDDYVTYVESIGEPAALVGWSGGATQALGVAARSGAVNAVAPFEPMANSVMGEQEQAALGAAVGRMAELAAQGHLTAAMRAFAGWPCTDDDIAMADEVGYFETTGRYAPNLLGLLQQIPNHDGPMPEDPVVLGAIAAPVLITLGTDSKPIFATMAQHVADHVPNARMQQISGAGHAAPLTHPAALADALAEWSASLVGG